MASIRGSLRLAHVLELEGTEEWLCVRPQGNSEVLDFSTLQQGDAASVRQHLVRILHIDVEETRNEKSATNLLTGRLR
jgi:hypothetical protein